jgi:phage terminase large subunit GpA-like protein
VDPDWFSAAGGIEALSDGAVPHLVDNDGAVVIPFKLRKAERQVLKRQKFLAPSAWAQKHRYISRRFRHGGRWRNDTVPYAAGIMDASFFKSVEEIGICAVPQSAKTELVYTCISYATDQRPGDVMILFPNELDAKDNAKDRIKPMYQDSPRMRRYLTGYMDDMGAHKLTLNNMIIYMAWANSPGRLSNRPCMYGYADEEDKHPATSGKKEASPVDLLKKRSTTFEGIRKIWRTSSPSIETGPIWRFMTDQAHVVYDYWVKCPECGAWQLMTFERIKWTQDVYDPRAIEESRDVWYACEKCGGHWDDHIKKQAVRDGQWRDRETGLELFASLASRQPLRIGFHIPGWISPFIKLYEIAAAFLKSLKGQPNWRNKLKDFNNGFCAQPWRITEAQQEETRILALSDKSLPKWTVPGNNQVSCLLAGVDTHGKDDTGRLDYEIRAFGWGTDPTTWGIRQGALTSFEALAEVLWQHQYKDSAGNRYPVRLACIDSMGRRTSEVYQFCRRHRWRIMPCQGKRQLTQPIAYSDLEYYPGTKKRIPGGLRLVRHDTNYFKNELSSTLEVDPLDPGAWRYHAELTVEWARQMCAEGINPDTLLWENPQGKPNHAWDVSVLLLVAAEILGIYSWNPPAAIDEAPAKKRTGPAEPKNRRSTRW